jgi:hypothetical protein
MKTMPSNFDFQFFFKGFDILLEMDNLISCEKCLWLITKLPISFPVFCRFFSFRHTKIVRQQKTAGKERRIVLYKKILWQNFYKLFFRWSFNIRLLMQNLVLYQCRNWFENTYCFCVFFSLCLATKKQFTGSPKLKPQAAPSLADHPQATMSSITS